MATTVALPSGERGLHRGRARRAAGRTFRPDIEGLRAIAVLLVVFGHAGVSQVSGGYIGVDVFFVLSGFLITGILLAEHEKHGSISLVGFYARRARRILPAGTLVLAATLVAGALVFGGTRADRMAEDGRWAALFASNVRFIQQGTDYWSSDLPASPLQHYWSLAVEEQFYFAWPACVIACSFIARGVSLRAKLAPLLAAVIAVSLGWSVYQTADNATVAYFSPFPRAWELAAGALIAVAAPWLPRLPRLFGVALSLLGLAAIALAAVTFSPDTPFPGYAVALPVLGTALAVAGGTVAPAAGAEWLLRHAPFQWIGKLSYSIYLWHWPLLIIGAAYLPGVVGGLFLGLLAVPLSAVTFLLVEDPARHSKRLRARPAAVSVAFGACLVALAFGLATGLAWSLTW